MLWLFQACPVGVIAATSERLESARLGQSIRGFSILVCNLFCAPDLIRENFKSWKRNTKNLLHVISGGVFKPIFIARRPVDDRLELASAHACVQRALEKDVDEEWSHACSKRWELKELANRLERLILDKIYKLHSSEVYLAVVMIQRERVN